MQKVECPCCGANLRIVVEPISALTLPDTKSRPAKSEYAKVRDHGLPEPKHYPTMPPVAAPLPKVPEKKYRTNTDVGAFRQALADAGFVEQAADGLIFNDKNVDSRRLKLWFGKAVVDGSKAQMWALNEALKKYFGDRLISHGKYVSEGYMADVKGCTSYIVRLEL